MVLTNEVFLRVSKMSPEERFDYSLEQVIEHQQLWGLLGENGWLMLKAEDDACLPVWPHESFAVAWEKDDFPDCKPHVISLQEWCEVWLPGMQQNGTLILNFPVGDDEEGIIISAKEMLESLGEMSIQDNFVQKLE